MNEKDELSAKVEQVFESQLHFLKDLVAIESVSSDPGRAGEMEKGARFVAEAFKSLGMDTKICVAPKPSGQPGAPAVIAKRHVDDAAPTVLLYAHYDVQPEGDASGWDSAPFQTEIRGGRIYGRGTSDDGAGVTVHYGVLDALKEDLPVNTTVFIEGEEEVGSPSFSAFLDKYKEDLEADVIIVADSSNWTEEIPAITSSLRGVATIDVTVKVLDQAVHSGMFGGPVLDAITVAARLITTLHDSAGDVAVSGLGGNPTSEVEFDEASFRADAGTVPGLELSGTADLAARLWTMPAISVIGIDAPSVADSANAIVPECTFRLSLRTVPGTDTAAAAGALVKHLQDRVPFGAELKVEIQEEGPSYIADLESPEAKLLREVLTEAYNVDAVAVGLGGSIPFISEFERVFPGAAILVTGVEDPQTKAHSNNESQSVATLRNATLAEARLLAALGS